MERIDATATSLLVCRPALELRESLLEEASLSFRVNKLERAMISRAGLFEATKPAQQLRARRVQIVVAVELETLDQGERGGDVTCFGDGGGLVELDDRRVPDQARERRQQEPWARGVYLVGGAIAVAAAAVMLPGLRALRAEQSAAAAAEAIGEVE